MSNTRPLMPKATAVWLVDNTAVTFDQIAEFCGLHPLEIKGIADGDVASGIKGMDPVSSGQLTRDEIKRGEEKSDHKLKLAAQKVELPKVSNRKRGPRYTPVSRRQDRPNAILWLVRNHPELKDAQISRLAGTTKATITQIRDRSHWNSTNLVPQDPVTLGLCTQIDLDNEVLKAAPRVPKPAKSDAVDEMQDTLLPAAATTPATKDDVFGEDGGPTERDERDQEEAQEAAKMFEQLQKLGEEKVEAETSATDEKSGDDEAVEESAPEENSESEPS